MNKGDLVDKVADTSGITKSQAQDAVNCVFDCVASAMKDGDKASFIGFGTFSVNRRNARTGRNPQTGKEIQIPAKNIVKFKPGKALSEHVN